MPFRTQNSSIGSQAQANEAAARHIEMVQTIFEDIEKPMFEKLKDLLESMIGETKNCGARTHQVDTKLVSKFMVMEK
jgi:hypothetical protein